MSLPFKTPSLSAFEYLKVPFGYLPQVLPRVFNGFWIVACIMLAVAALYNLTQLSDLKKEVSARRLLEASMQDLLMQSTAMRYLAIPNPKDQADKLKRYGYDGPLDVIDQLKSRIAITRTLEPEFDLKDWTEELKAILQTIETQTSQKPLPKQLELDRHLDKWFVTLSALGSYTRHLSLIQDQRAANLQQRNLYLAIAVLVYSLLLVNYHLWTKKRQNRQFMVEMASLHDETRTDPLTGILNRRGWTHYVNKTLKKVAKFGRTSVSVAILDIDYFKQYNDTFGHDAGDQRLIEFANVLKSHFRPCDMVARVGGEEFAVLLPNCTVDDAKRIIDRIRTAENCEIAFSAGIASLEDCRSVERAMAVADQALYQAKSSGRNRACIAHPS